MILKTKDEILHWLKKNDRNYKENMKKNAYEFIDIYDMTNQSLLNELIKEDRFFEILKTQGHQYIVNVKDSSNLYNKKLIEIPFQFYHIKGTFNCSDNQIISLKGCPRFVHKNFFCNYNQLISLEYCPQFIQGYFNCSNNQIKSLDYTPDSFNGINISMNKIVSLKGIRMISGDLRAHYNEIESLEYFPEFINGDIFLQNNQKLLKYKNQSCEKMTDDDFFKNKKFLFWYQFHLEEKARQENKKIIENLNTSYKTENEVKNKKNRKV